MAMRTTAAGELEAHALWQDAVDANESTWSPLATISFVIAFNVVAWAGIGFAP